MHFRNRPQNNGDHVGLAAEAYSLITTNKRIREEGESTICLSDDEDNELSKHAAKRMRKAESSRLRYHRQKEQREKKSRVDKDKLMRAVQCQTQNTTQDDSNLAQFVSKLVNSKVLKFETWGKKIEEKVMVCVTQMYPATRNYRGYTRAKEHQDMGQEFREYIIRYNVVLSKTRSQWTNLFKIRRSEIPKAGNGLFAARTFTKGQTMGLFFGKQKKSEECSVYTMATLEYGNVDPMGGLTSRHPLYFGIHIANDPIWSATEKNDGKSHNIWVGDDLIVRASCDIQRDEELYLNYRNGFGTSSYVECECHGCTSAAKHE
jgi:hypothetical protein